MRALAVVLAVLVLVALAAVLGSLGSGADEADAEAEPAAWTYGESMSQRRSYIAAAEIGGEI